MTRDEWLRQEIEKYRRKIDLYTAMIAEWQSELGVAAPRQDVGFPIDSNGKKPPTPGADPLSAVQGMIFFGKSQPEAVRSLLELVGYPLKTAQLVDGIERGGAKVGGATPAAKKTNLYTILQRSQDFGKVARDTWGLVEWPGVTKKSADDDKKGDAASDAS